MFDSKRITNFIDKRKIPILLFWISITILIVALYTPDFFDRTKSEFDPPEGSDVDDARNLLQQYFPEKIDEITHLVVVNNPNGMILSYEFAEFTAKIIKEMQSTFPDEFVQVAGYYVFYNTSLDSVKNEFLSKDGSTSIVFFTFNAKLDFQEEITLHLRKFISKMDFTSFNAYTTGMSELDHDTTESIEQDMSRIDSIVIPLVFIALVILLRNWRYFPITMTPIALTIGLSFGILERYIAFTDATIQSFVPSVLISIVLGVGVDYNLFLLTRFREERLNGKSLFDSTTIMMKYAGHTVFTSGLTLTISLAGLTLFPISILSSVGIAITVAILVLLAINLTLTPALLLIFGNWIEKTPQETKITASKENSSKEKTSYWYKIGKAATKYNYILLVVILLLTLPLAFQMLESTPNAETTFFAPRGSESAEGFDLLQEHFGPGSIGPLQVVVVPSTGNVWTQETFNSLHSFITRAIEETSIDRMAISSHAWLNGSKITYEQAFVSISPDLPYYNLPESVLYRQFSSAYVSSVSGSEAMGAIVEIILPVDPSSLKAKDILNILKSVALEVFGEKFKFGFTGITPDSQSSIERTFDMFPLMIIIVIIGIYVLVGLMFRAVILPGRLIVTIGLTIAFIYGAATVVFEKSTFLNDIFPALDDVSVTFWMVPVMSFSIILGLGIDYDIFTIERIKENIWNGMDNNEGIARGIDKTARVITGAGIIMMIAFGGLMFSSSYILVQFGFVLTFAVLLDTFIVRTLLVPAIMSFAENLNWWPNHPPTLSSDGLEIKKEKVSKADHYIQATTD